MSDPKVVPQVRLEGKTLAAPVRYFWSCHVCNHQVSAMSESGVAAAMDEHQTYVNRLLDPLTDPHFKEARLDALMV